MMNLEKTSSERANAMLSFFLDTLAEQGTIICLDEITRYHMVWKLRYEFHRAEEKGRASGKIAEQIEPTKND